MKKIVPDPPSSSPPRTTAHHAFVTCGGTHAPVLAICPGTTLDDVLVHLSASLAAAMEINMQVCDMVPKPVQRLTWATQHSLEICDAMLSSVMPREEQPEVAGQVI